MESEAKKLVCGVDWVTATTNNDVVGKVWYDVFVSLAKVTDPSGVDTKSGVKLSRYTGVGAPSLFWGTSSQLGFILIARSSVANMAWTKVAMTAKKVTRLDLAVTVHLEDQKTGLAARHYAMAGKGENTQRKYGVILNSRGGQTCYVGSRQSNFYGRVYDKGAEQGEENGYVWRYEVECKSPNNLIMVKEMYQRWLDDKPVMEDICEYVWRWFKDRGVSPIFRPKGGVAFEIDAQMVSMSNERRIAWLSKYVRPTVGKLIEAGKGKAAMSALGVELKQLEMWEKEIDLAKVAVSSKEITSKGSSRL